MRTIRLHELEREYPQPLGLDPSAVARQVQHGSDGTWTDGTDLAALLMLAASRCGHPTSPPALEIGTAHGRTTNALADVCQNTVYTIGLDRRFSHVRIEPGFERETPNDVDFCKYAKRQVELGHVISLRGDSHAWDCQTLLGRCGFVFIDGDHTFRGVMADTLLAVRCAANGGVIAWHDYGRVPDVTRFIDAELHSPAVGLGPHLTYVRDSAVVFCQLGEIQRVRSEHGLGMSLRERNW